MQLKILGSFVALSMGVFVAGDIRVYALGAATSREAAAQTVYKCIKIDEKIIIDGQLDETVWRKVEPMQFVHITEGTEPFYLTEARMCWNDQYLYVGFYFEEPDVRGYWSMNDALLPDDFRLNADRHQEEPYWGRSECQIMRIDRFAKVFLDSDGNGDNYLEFHVNALNNIFDAWYKQGFTGGEWGNRFRFPDVAWECPGLLTATRIHGSINNPGDMDDGWSLEMAIPWKSLQSFTIGSCPPESGDIWGGHFGRVFRDQPGGKNTYWVWPFLAVENCHLPDRYGKIIFEDSTRKFERFFAWGAKADDDFMKQAADAGVTDLIVSPGLAANSKLGGLCQKYGINLYPVVTLAPSSWTKKYGDQQDAPLQQMDENEAKILAELQGEFHTETKPPTGSDFAPLPELQPAELQRKMPANMGRDNIKFQKAYQWGGEPIRKYLRSWGVNREALVCKGMLCFHHQAVKEVLYQKIDELLAIPGINGMAFDGIGYQNYHCCHCPESMRLYREYCQANHLEENRNSLDRFSMETLVEFQNELVDYVKSVKHDAVTVNHIWPVFLPEPLYGNRLNVDYCGQTAAWYFLWDPFRIANYSKIISAEQNKYFPEVKGVAFIGYYDSNQKAAFPCKSPERVDLELRAILRGGSNLLMMCGLPDLLANPDVAAVFKKFMQKKGQ